MRVASWFAVGLLGVVFAGCAVENAPSDEEGPTSSDEAELRKWCRLPDSKKLIRVGTSINVDCNTCVCTLGGSLSCTEMACAETCSYGGSTYNVGDTFKSTDGCNTCSCGTGGSVACTEKACAPKCDPATELNRKYMGDPSTCMLIRFACEPNTTMFSNDCGCGCEQPADCPEWINCMPGPSSTTCAALREKCPYSQVAY